MSKEVADSVAVMASFRHFQVVGDVVRYVLDLVILEIAQGRARPDPFGNVGHLAFFELVPEQPRQIEQASLNTTIDHRQIFWLKR